MAQPCDAASGASPCKHTIYQEWPVRGECPRRRALCPEPNAILPAAVAPAPASAGGGRRCQRRPLQTTYVWTIWAALYGRLEALRVGDQAEDSAARRAAVRPRRRRASAAAARGPAEPAESDRALRRPGDEVAVRVLRRLDPPRRRDARDEPRAGRDRRSGAAQGHRDQRRRRDRGARPEHARAEQRRPDRAWTSCCGSCSRSGCSRSPAGCCSTVCSAPARARARSRPRISSPRGFRPILGAMSRALLHLDFGCAALVQRSARTRRLADPPAPDDSPAASPRDRARAARRRTPSAARGTGAASHAATAAASSQRPHRARTRRRHRHRRRTARRRAATPALRRRGRDRGRACIRRRA